MLVVHSAYDSASSPLNPDYISADSVRPVLLWNLLYEEAKNFSAECLVMTHRILLSTP